MDNILVYPHRVPSAAAATLRQHSALRSLITSLGCPAGFPESSLFFKHLCRAVFLRHMWHAVVVVVAVES